MTDLDRAKVIKGLEEAYKVIEHYVPEGYRGYSRLSCYDAIALLREREPVVVRCKDCKYWHDPMRCQMDSEGLKTPDNWFCADAERR